MSPDGFDADDDFDRKIREKARQLYPVKTRIAGHPASFLGGELPLTNVAGFAKMTVEAEHK